MSVIAQIRDIANDIKVSWDNNAPTGAVMLVYCAIDAMSFLSMPSGKEEVIREYFISWVEKYMNTDSSQPYQYCGIDLYGARCGLLHNYTAESRLSRAGKCKLIVYATDDKHRYDPVKDPNVVIFGVRLFISDFFAAVEKFLGDIESDDDLRRKVEERLPKMFRVKTV